MTISEFGDQCGDFIYNNMGWVVVGLIALGLVVFGLSALAFSSAHGRFMAECLEYRPQYECTAMWRGANQSSGTHVQPVIIPMR